MYSIAKDDTVLPLTTDSGAYSVKNGTIPNEPLKITLPHESVTVIRHQEK
jgi:hypothetical protein